MRHVVQWTAPAPLWSPAPLREGPSGTVRLRRPAILRFATDSFMEELIAMLATDPSRLSELEARYENWREPLGTKESVVAAPVSTRERLLARIRVAGNRRLALATGGAFTSMSATAATTARTLKLYQPAHQRYYLVAACLVCQMPGLPDRTLNPARQERASFVMRRLRQVTVNGVTTTSEYALVTGPNGGWQDVGGAGDTLQPGEEQLPLFAMNFDDDTGYQRRLLAGLVPVGRREAYLGASAAAATAAAAPVVNPSGEALDPGAPPPPVDPRTALFVGQVSEPWKALVARARKDNEALTESSGQNTTAMVKEAREGLQVSSWYVLLDFAAFLQRYLPNVWATLAGAGSPATAAEQALVAALSGATVSAALRTSLLSGIGRAAPIPSSLGAALTAVSQVSVSLERATGPYDRNAPAADWPSFLFPLADPVETGPLPAVSLAAPAPSVHSERLRKISRLAALVTAALPATSQAPTPPTPLAAQPVMAPGERGLFVMRCVYERPDCGPFDPTVVSDPTEPFELAGFFDPDAPARPIRIALPVDTTPAGLRKFDRNTAFMMSDVLCGQVARAKGLGFIDLVRSVLPFPFHKDLSVPDSGPCKTDDGMQLGMICSISIPIITICALILLMIIVSLLDIIFRWLPFFVFCFPLPGFKAKEEAA